MEIEIYWLLKTKLLGNIHHTIGHQIVGCENGSGSIFQSEELAGAATPPRRHKVPFYYESWIRGYAGLAQCFTVALIAFRRDEKLRRSLNVRNAPVAQFK